MFSVLIFHFIFIFHYLHILKVILLSLIILYLLIRFILFLTLISKKEYYFIYFVLITNIQVGLIFFTDFVIFCLKIMIFKSILKFVDLFFQFKN